MAADAILVPQGRLVETAQGENDDLLGREAEDQFFPTTGWWVRSDKQVVAHKAGNTERRAVILAQPQTHETRHGQPTLVAQVLVRGLHPEHPSHPGQEQWQDL
jgi:hypothetical protein